LTAGAKQTLKLLAPEGLCSNAAVLWNKIEWALCSMRIFRFCTKK